MTWATLIPIIAQYGLPLAAELVNLWTTNSTPSAADFANLQALASKKAVDQMTVVLQQQGISPTSPQGIALLALVA
jgi:hypothetical protein